MYESPTCVYLSKSSRADSKNWLPLKARNLIVTPVIRMIVDLFEQEGAFMRNILAIQ
jgi:hypothetical protein